VTDLSGWLTELQTRHRQGLTNPEFLKALRALSIRYVERRAELGHRSPLDTAGKRAAFAAFYAPQHLLTTMEVVRAVGADQRKIDLVVDLGCGTGVGAAAWALALGRRPRVFGVDGSAWALTEAAWNWRQLGVDGRTARGDVLAHAEQLLTRPRVPLARTGVVMAWAVNELDRQTRDSLATSLAELARRGAHVLVIEPLARSAAPWWSRWTSALGGEVGEWKFDVRLPEPLRQVDEAAGFRREGLGARSLWIAPAAG
jgi:SAM-dependent methyltransferase